MKLYVEPERMLENVEKKRKLLLEISEQKQIKDWQMEEWIEEGMAELDFIQYVMETYEKMEQKNLEYIRSLEWKNS